MTKVYIAGSCKNRVITRRLMDEIKTWGHEIVLDWTTCRISDVLFANTTRKNNDRDIECVKEDIKELKECECLIFCMDSFKSRGKYFELGYATAMSKPIGIFLFPSLSLSDAMKDESILIRSKIYPILHNVDELKTWLSNVKTN